MASKKLCKALWLNTAQVDFCHAYVKKETFMNGTKAYMSVYKDCTENSAKVNASTLLTNPNILNYIDSLIDNTELNDERVDKELKKLVLQDEEKNVKLWAMKMYNDLKARVEKWRLKALEKEKEGENRVEGMTNEELIKLAYGDSKQG